LKGRGFTGSGKLVVLKGHDFSRAAKRCNLGQRRNPGQFGDGLVRQRADLRHLRHQPRHGAVGYTLDLETTGVREEGKK
jgi:hypothetical protein